MIAVYSLLTSFASSLNHRYVWSLMSRALKEECIETCNKAKEKKKMKTLPVENGLLELSKLFHRKIDAVD